MENIKNVSLKGIAIVTNIEVDKLVDLPLSVVAELVAKNGAKYKAEREDDSFLVKHNLK